MSVHFYLQGLPLREKAKIYFWAAVITAILLAARILDLMVTAYRLLRAWRS